MTQQSLFSVLWERHKNPWSWLMRPLFGATLLYGAWMNSLLVVSISLFGLATSWFWFPKPRNTYPWVERFIDTEKDYLTPPWTLQKVLGLGLTALFLIATTLIFWTHQLAWGLLLYAGGSLFKSIWSLFAAKRAGIPAAIIGLISALGSGLIYAWLKFY